MAVVRRAAIKQKRELVLLYFYFSFIAVVRAALETFGPINDSAHEFLSNVRRKISLETLLFVSATLL